MKIKDRPEFKTKARPLTFPPDAMVSTAVAAMTEFDYGSVVIVDPNDRVVGMVTERDILKRLVNNNMDSGTTPLKAIMTTDVRVAQADDEILDWLRMMSNERFRRVPVVDEDGRIIAIMTQGDFVSYTWPELLHQAAQLTKATVGANYQLLFVLGGILLYLLVVISLLTSAGLL